MEALKEKFDTLSESEKNKFLLEIVKANTDINKHSLFEAAINNDLLLSGQKRGSEDSLQQGCSESEPRKKQKTLDSWLIKSDGSSPKNKIDKLPCENKELKNSSSFDKNSVFENTQTISEGVSNHENVRSSNSLHTVLDQNDTSRDLENVVDKVVTRKKNSKDDICDTETSKVVEKYNLRKKKLKSTDSISPVREGKVNSKSNATNVSSSKNNYEAISHNQVSGNGKVSECNDDTLTSKVTKISKSKQTDLNLNASNHAQCAEKTTCLDNDVTTVPLAKKVPNSRTKSKKKSSENNTVNISNKPASDSIINELIIQPHVDEVVRTASLQSNYEAYCKLNAECSQLGLKIADLINDENIQNLLSDQTNLENEAVIFIGTFNSSAGEILPIVHQIQSKRELLESLGKLEENSSLKKKKVTL